MKRQCADQHGQCMSLAQYGTAALSQGSQSFALAAVFFNRECRTAARLLYSWCRYCDDAIDCAAQDTTAATLRALQQRTRDVLYGRLPTASQPAFAALHSVVRQYAIPPQYPLELLEGLAMDVRKARYRTFEELLVYCYRVAGTVGLMMAHIIGVRSPAAYRHAVDLGNAMQLTNIARDVLEDAGLGRVYLPEDDSVAALTPEMVLHLQHRRLVFDKVAALLRHADQCYRSGEAGLRYLPFRAAVAVAAASAIYADIGTQILRQGPCAWEQRIVVSTPRKIMLALRGLGVAVASRWHSSTRELSR